MRNETRTITLGEFTFNVAIDRHITCVTYEACPEETAFLFSKREEFSSDETNENTLLINAIKEKKLEKTLNCSDELVKPIAKLVEFALPLMLKKAYKGEASPVDAQYIIEYTKKNEVDIMFNNDIYELISLGFTLGEQDRKPKVPYAMK